MAEAADGLAIRSYRAADLDALIGLVRELQAFEQHIYDRLVPEAEIGAWYVERLLADCVVHKGEIRVATRGQLIVGYATIMTDVVCDEERDEIVYSYAYVGDLSVTATERGQGVGQALLADCEAIARATGAKWLRITAHAANDRARKLYCAFGFREQFVDHEKILD